MYIVHHLKIVQQLLATDVPVRMAMLVSRGGTTVAETATVRAGRVRGVVLEMDGVSRAEDYCRRARRVWGFTSFAGVYITRSRKRSTAYVVIWPHGPLKLQSHACVAHGKR